MSEFFTPNRILDIAIALIVILSLAVLGGGAAAYIFLVKPKLAVKADPTEETK